MANKLSLGTDFFGAARDFDRLMNSALDRVKQSLVKQGIYGLSISNLNMLAITLDLESASSHPLEIAEKGMMDKGAFNRGLSSLESQKLATLERDGLKVTSIKLTDEGRKIALIAQECLNKQAQEMLKSPKFQAVVGRFSTLGKGS